MISYGSPSRVVKSCTYNVCAPVAQAIEASLVVLETKANVGKSDIAARGNLAPTRS